MHRRKKATAGADEVFYASFLLVIHGAMIYNWAHCAQWCIVMSLAHGCGNEKHILCNEYIEKICSVEN